MDIPISMWFKQLYDYKPSKRQKLEEVTRENIAKTFQYMADHGSRIQDEFDELFDGKMRIAIPLVEKDTRNLVEIVDALKAEGWHPPGEGTVIRAFPTKIVKQKKRYLADEGGEEYEEEFRVATLNLERTYDYTIPAGPRAGETVEKTDNTTMSRAIAKLAKGGKIREELLEWWRRKQTFYTKDEDGYTAIEQMFAGNHPGDTWRLLVSRHPVDVLRMSDVGEISSCHREGGSHWHCAVQESQGNGLIVYLVQTKDLDEFLREEDSHMVEARKLINRSLDKKLTLDYGHKYLNDAENLKLVLGLLQTEWKGWNRVSDEAIALVTVDMLRDAIRARIDNKPWPSPEELPPSKPLEDFDQQEVFRDPQRNIPGMTASSRIRLRKFFDTGTGNWIAVPENVIYGREIDRFRTAVREWAWERQSYMFTDPADIDAGMELPREQYLQRFGGSYEDTSDGNLLNAFFSMSGTSVNVYHGNVEHLHDEEGDDAWETMNEELENVLDAARNQATHVSFHGEVGDEGDAPYMYGGADTSFDFEVEWEGKPSEDGEGFYHWPDDDRDATLIPKAWGSDYQRRRLFEKAVEDALGNAAYPESIEWDVEESRVGAPKTMLRIRLLFNFEENTPEEFDYFVSALISDLDDHYDELWEKVRRALVIEEYLPPNDFDRLYDDIKASAKELENWKPHGVDADDDYDGQIWFWFAPDDNANQVTVPLSIEFPTEIGNTPFAVEKIFPDGAVQDGGKINPGIKFRQAFAHKLLALQEAANNWSEEQLAFDFGEKYNRPTFEGVDLSAGSQLRFYISRDNQIDFMLKIIIESSDSQEEVEGAFHFMRFIDQSPRLIIAAVKQTFNEFLRHYQEKVAAQDREMLDGTKMLQLYHQLDSKYGAQAGSGDNGAEAAMMVAMWIRDNWEKMGKAEKYTAIRRYLRTLANGSMRPYGSWDLDNDTPEQWGMMVRSTLRELGAPESVRLAYDWGEEGSGPEPSEEEEDAPHGGVQIQEPVRGTVGAGQPVQESIEHQIDRVDKMLREGEGARAGREPIDLRIYKVRLGCVVDLDVAGTDSQIENQIRGIEEVTTVNHQAEMQKSVGSRRVFRVYDIKFELYGQQARDTYRDSILVPAVAREVVGVKVINRGPVQGMDNPLREWGGLGYAAPPYDHYLPTMPTPRVPLQSVLDDWAEGGVQIYDTPMNTNEMRYHVMMPVSDLWEYCSRYYRGTKTDFDGRYKRFIKGGARMPVYIALGQNGRAKITGNEDLIWFAKKSGLEELPVFFSYQRQV